MILLNAEITPRRSQYTNIFMEATVYGMIVSPVTCLVAVSKCLIKIDKGRGYFLSVSGDTVHGGWKATTAGVDHVISIVRKQQ